MRGYFGSIPAAQGQEFLYILTGGAASVSGADSLGRVLAYASQGLVRVFLNGARLTPNLEYTATNGTTITFVGWTAAANDELLIEVLTGLVVADTLRPAQNLSDVASAALARSNIGAAALLNPLTTIASAGTTDIGSAASQGVEITGTTTITSFGTVAAGTVRFGRFTGALTLTHNATSLILPSAANITTAVNDRFWTVSLGSGNWLVLNYVRASGAPIVSSGNAGEIVIVAGNAAPPGTIKANGATINRADFPALWTHANASGNIVAEGSWTAGRYSTGNLTTTFRIPDLRGEFIRAWADGGSIDSGRGIGTSQAQDFQSHTHTGSIGFQPGSGAGDGGSIQGISNGFPASVTLNNTGGTETRPRNIALLYCIRI